MERAPRAADPLLHTARRWVLPLTRPRFPIERRHGAMASGEPASMVLIGQGMQLDYFSRGLFPSPPTRDRSERVGLHRLRRRLKQALDEADLVLATVPRAFTPALAGDDFLQAPSLVDFLLSTADPGLPGASLALRNTVRKVKTGQSAAGRLRSRVATDASEFERFYEDFHVPMVRERYGALAVVQPRRVLRRRFRLGGLLWVERDGEPLGGDIYDAWGGTLIALVGGRRRGLDPAMASLVQHATYVFVLDHARALGCHQFNMGGAIPVLTNGVFEHKRGWGATVQPRDETHFALLVGWRHANAAVLRCLSELPLVVHDARGLSAIGAVPDQGPANPQTAARLCRMLLPEGIRRMILLASAGWLPIRPGVAMPPADQLLLARAGSSADLRVALASG